MNVLGISYDFHDASAAIITDGKLEAVGAEERYSLHKHDHSYPGLAIRAVLDHAGMRPEDIDSVAYYERPGSKFSRILTTSFADFPAGLQTFPGAARSWLQRKLWVRASLSSRLKIEPKNIHLVAHHLSHAAQAFYASPFEDAAVLILDGVGEWSCTTLAIASSRTNENIRIVEEYEYPNSIGLVYAAITAYLGFKPNSGESSTMALAAFGTPRYVDEIRRIIHPETDGSYKVSSDYFNFEGGEDELFSTALVDLLGAPRKIKQPYPFDALTCETAASQDIAINSDDQRHADIAASLQEVLVEIMLGLLKRLRAHYSGAHLCIAGGVALNCLANSRIVRESDFREFFVPPDPGDGGAAFGAAMYVAADSGPIDPIRTPYLGNAYEDDEALRLLRADPSVRFLLGKECSGVVRAESIDWVQLDDEAELLYRTTDDLQAGRIVGWFQGRFELGPRALGNRSLLVLPTRVDTIRRLSTTVKSHVSFRPYALSLTETSAAQVLDMHDYSRSLARWMQSVWPVKEAYRDRLQAGIHADGTTRPQICSENDNPRYWRLLRCVGEATGIEALVNTSMNERSMPIVSSPYLALVMFARRGIDTLVIGNIMLRKRYKGIQ
jgi:carbamoyltransferase